MGKHHTKPGSHSISGLPACRVWGCRRCECTCLESSHLPSQCIMVNSPTRLRSVTCTKRQDMVNGSINLMFVSLQKLTAGFGLEALADRWAKIRLKDTGEVLDDQELLSGRTLVRFLSKCQSSQKGCKSRFGHRSLKILL